MVVIEIEAFPREDGRVKSFLLTVVISLLEKSLEGERERERERERE